VKLPVNTRVLYTLSSALFIILGSLIAIRYAQGYRFSLSRNNIVKGTGLLVANSFPSGAEVHINGKLYTATDTTVYLEPGQYNVEIYKDGYSTWQKNISIEPELVTQTNAQLFRKVPSLTPLTFTGARNISPSPDGEKILFYTASASAKTKDGLYLLDMTNGLLTGQREPRQIAEEAPGFDLDTAQFIWSPENTQVLLSSNGHEVLLELDKMNSLATLPDIGLRKKQILSEWESEMYLRERQFLGKFPPEFLKIATESAKNIYLSPDKKRVMYTATASAMIPENISPGLPASNTQAENREIQPNHTYVYDREEDKNFLITFDSPTATASTKVLLANDLFNKEAMKLTASPSSFLRLTASTSAQTAHKFSEYYSSLYGTGLQWFPDSKHLLFTDKDRIYLVGYDNTNKTPVYNGPFLNNFVYPWPDGSKVLILTTFSANTPVNLYGIELK
jgi:hypothetical protein